MARTIVEIPIQVETTVAAQMIGQIMQSNGFHFTDYRGAEQVWKKGVGVLTAMQYLRVDYSPQKVMLSAWIQPGLGKAGIGELDLSGVAAIVPKKALKKVVNQVTAAFGQPGI